jgi:hypothetical protein
VGEASMNRSAMGKTIIENPDSVIFGRSAATTMKRKIVWEEIIWPLVLEKQVEYFTWEDYKKRCLEYYDVDDLKIIYFKVLGPLSSLVQRGIITKQNTSYLINHKLRQYLRLCKKVSYGLAARISTTKD